jgi:cytochrome c2
MKDAITIAVFTVTVSLIYTAIAQVLPQLENHPPANVELGSNIGPEELAAAGADSFAANCTSCHKAGENGRAPDISDIGARADERAAMRAAETGESYTGVDYLVEALCAPGDYLVEGFGNIMPPQGRSLTGGQILAMTAYLQTLGGDATVRGTAVDPVMRFGCVSGGAAAAGAPMAEAAAPVSVGTPDKAYEKFGCSGCHALEGDERKIGPSLYDVGKRLSKGEIYESILAPDAAMSAGDPPYAGGVMKSTLDGNGFYTSMTPADYQALVDWLAAKKG